MYYRPRFLEKLERKLKWLSIPNLMLIVVGAMGVVFVMNYLIGMSAGQSIYSMLTFDKALIAKGQVWRVFTFLFLPPSGNVFFALIGLYFYWLIGSSLENEWGSFGFTVFYLLGAVGAIISGLITGYATNDYLNMSLFLAFALLNPNYTVYVFFIIPVKMKWLALIDGLGIIASLIFNGWSGRLVMRVKQAYGRWKWKRNLK